jgi:hypothetical protein
MKVAAIESHDIGDWPLPRADEFVQHPDWERRLLTRREGGNDDFIERQSEGQHATGQKGRSDLRQYDITEGLKAIGSQIHGGFNHAAAGAAKTCQDIIVNDNHAEGGVAQHDGPG